MYLCTMLELARSGKTLKRGLKLALVADEEAGCVRALQLLLLLLLL